MLMCVCSLALPFAGRYFGNYVRNVREGRYFPEVERDEADILRDARRASSRNYVSASQS